MATLTPKQAQFVQEYLVDQNATQAYIRAFKSTNTRSAQAESSKLLSNPIVRASVDLGLEKLRAEAEKRAKQKNIISKEQWLAIVAEIASADITRFLEIEGNRIKVKDTKLWGQGAGRLVRKVSQSAQGAVSLELHPKGHEIEMLAKHFGWIKDQLEHSGGIDTGPGLNRDDLKAMFSDPETMELTRALALKMSQPKDPAGSN